MRTTALLALLAGCTPTLNTEHAQVDVEVPGIVQLHSSNVANVWLEGTWALSTLVCATETCPEGDWRPEDCFLQEVTGPGTLATDGTFTVDGPGEVRWTLTARACPANDLGWAPTDDALSVTGVAATDVTRAYLTGPLEEALDELVAGGMASAEVPAGWLPEEGEPWRILEGATVTAAARLGTAEGGVAWQGSDARLSIGSAAPAEGLVTGDGSVVLAAPDAPADVVLELAGGTFPLGGIERASAEDAVALEVVPVYLLGDAGSSLPYGARAVVWDAAGAPLFGAPVTWTVDGDLATGGTGFTTGTEYVAIADCLAPSDGVGPRTATLTATWNGLSASAPLSWTQRDAPEEDGDWTIPSACVPEEAAPVVTEGEEKTGCGCATGGGLGGLLPIALATLAARRRARESRSRAAAR